MKNIKFNTALLKEAYGKIAQKLSGRMLFIAIMAVLLVYVFAVWKISQLVAAEPTPEALDAALSETSIPKVNSQAIKQIQSLEESSKEVKSLFDKARNNPFQE